MNDNSGFRTAPTDEQIRDSILFIVGFQADVHRLEPADWERFADRSSDPVPGTFEDALLQTLAELGIQTSAESQPRVEVEDRPPRATPLFARYFVDLTALASQLVSDFGVQVASGVFISLIFNVGSKMKPLIGGGGDDRLQIREYFNVNTMEVLCENFVRIHRPNAPISGIAHRAFNTRYEGGYTTRVSPELPMGWIITVDLKDEQFEFTVDGNANIHKLEIIQNSERFTMENASLKSPDIAVKTRQRLKPWTGVVDADSLF